MDASTFFGLKPPRLDSTGGVVTGADTPKHRIENKQRCQATLANQAVESHWTIYKGEFELPDQPTPLAEHQGEMCPSRLALCHPATDLLRSGPHTAALPTPECHGLLSRCKLLWTGDLIVWLYPTKPSLILGLRLTKRLKLDRLSLWRGTPSRTTHRRN